jgi:two-component system, chemotaxis family, sensor kinase CheA
MDLDTRHVLVGEARELLANMETALLEIERDGYDAERINAVFRAAHTIKGSSGLFGLVLIERFCQRMENVLDDVRAGKLRPEPPLFALVLECGDYIARLVDAIEGEREHDDPDPVARERLLAELARWSGAAPAAARSPQGSRAETPAAKPRPQPHHLSMRCTPDLLADGVCPSAYLEHLATMGELTYVCTVTDALPSRQGYMPGQSYFGFEVGVCTALAAEELRTAFELAAEKLTVRIFAAGTPQEELLAHLEGFVAERDELHDAFYAAGLLSPPREPVAPEGLPQKRATEVAPAGSAANAKPADERRAAEQRMVKVDAGRLDQLINLVGELVIASEGARVSAQNKATPRDAMVEAVARVTQLVEHIRDRALTMRMTPIGDIFQRFPRVVRDVSRELDKQIELEISGADSELDKSMVEKLADPLLHIVRNAIDHGIEPVSERVQSGKPAAGHVGLHAHHESGCIVVEVRDDGRGLDPARLRKKAIERGVVSETDVLSREDCYQLIFAPGFSTAEAVTSLSGRGVGMDVVKRNLEALRGEIEIESEVGRGTTFRLRLPLTLAIIEGFHVEVGDTTFVIPLDMVEECVDLRERDGRQHVLNLRGKPLPFVRLRDVFKLDAPPSARESLVVVSAGHHRVGVVVDRLLGNSQAVIKPLGQLFRGLHGVSSSTILGDGSVALILDVPAIVGAAVRAAAQTGAHAGRSVEGASP